MISICLPTLNSERFLQERLASILAQTHTDWHIINVDSGSADNTLSILKKTIAPEKISYFTHPPGLYASWNRCIAEATGDFVHFATSDDLEDPDFYACSLRAASLCPAEIVHCHYRIISESGETLLNSRSHHWSGKFFDYREGTCYLKERSCDLIGSVLMGSSPGTFNSMLIRRSAFEKVGLFPENYGTSGGDWMWYLRAAASCSVCCIDRTLASWRMQDRQATQPYARFSKYGHEIGMIRDFLDDLLKNPPSFLDPHHLLFLKNYRAQLLKLTIGSPFFYPLFLWIKPDLLVHAVSKKILPPYAPFYHYRWLLHQLLPGLKIKRTSL
jgi:glycosyltransferase involved in cell wall biosynthesis